MRSRTSAGVTILALSLAGALGCSDDNPDDVRGGVAGRVAHAGAAGRGFGGASGSTNAGGRAGASGSSTLPDMAGSAGAITNVVGGSDAGGTPGTEAGAASATPGGTTNTGGMDSSGAGAFGDAGKSTSTGGVATGGAVNGGAVNGGAVNGGAVNGGTTAAGTATGGTSNGGTATGGTSNGGAVTAGTSHGVAGGSNLASAGSTSAGTTSSLAGATSEPASAGRAGTDGSNNVAGGGAAGTVVTPQAGAAGTAAAALHGAVEDIGSGLSRITYDFSTAAQLEDWEAAVPSETDLSVDDGKLRVHFGNTPSDVNVALALFKRPLRVTRVRFEGTVIESPVGAPHLNVYLATEWQGTWNPLHGYGCIHPPVGRFFAIDASLTNVYGSDAIQLNTPVLHEIVVSSDTITWISGASSITLTHANLYPFKDRRFGLGGYTSTVDFDDIVLEGEL